MPQLNPSPWFSLLIVSWLVILFIMMPSILSHQTQNTISTQQKTKQEQPLWTWPWR
uniref:ATP synthase F0 subunit 8 n=1 Tax=Mordacia mordax TaxID=7755 RepID=UPI0022DCE3BC|nr:ATP synthase F0 subunit 8 [Mordacia mordax]YP_010587551.1 ATP synthase F0 subunit 8 [Mordacia praecox]WAB46095.1 ATP synthase F0 subunit 8 [Mordacia mordax]WAB46108.1 ATP synthase F0 subunit 8 [Mordacia praecox]